MPITDAQFTDDSNTHNISLPFTEASINKLKAGDRVSLDGTIFTARDAVHKYLANGGSPPCDLTHAVIYHCGPVVTKTDGQYKITAAGPTTSMREEPYMATLIEKYRLRAVIGKGGMGRKTLEACRKFGCLYLQTIGGAAQVLATAIKNIDAVYFEEKFGSPEAVWQLHVSDFPAIVTMDAKGNNLHDTVKRESQQKRDNIFAAVEEA